MGGCVGRGTEPYPPPCCSSSMEEGEAAGLAQHSPLRMNPCAAFALSSESTLRPKHQVRSTAGVHKRERARALPVQRGQG
jgi:hypothetical protein